MGRFLRLLKDPATSAVSQGLWENVDTSGNKGVFFGESSMLTDGVLSLPDEWRSEDGSSHQDRAEDRGNPGVMFSAGH